MKKDTNSRVLWCAKQKKGIKLVEPNLNLSEAYLKKANNSLKAMKISSDAGLLDWAVDAAYYARYQAVYALLQKCGIESEIHECSIALIRCLFEDELGKDAVSELENAKKNRISLVYYTDKFVPAEEIQKNIRSAPAFVLTIEKIISRLNDLTQVRGKLKKIIK